MQGASLWGVVKKQALNLRHLHGNIELAVVIAVWSLEERNIEDTCVPIWVARKNKGKTRVVNLEVGSPSVVFKAMIQGEI